MDFAETITRALAELERLTLALPGARADWEASRLEFASEADWPSDRERALRHREWYLLERHSPALGDVPLALLGPELAVHDDHALRDAAAVLVDSRVSVFEVRDVEPGRSLWLHDLLGLGALPVRESRASLELATGDLVVGRLFGIGDGEFALSAAMAVFRSPGLVEALEADVERLRAGRRGSLRIAQVELEAMFFQPRAPHVASDAAPLDPADEERRARALLVMAGFDDEDCAELASTLRAAAAGAAELGNAAIADVLERAAFESDVELDPLRRALASWWGALQGSTARRTGEPKRPVQRERERAARDARDARAALAAFDAGRAEGRDLETLFRDLESDLGLDREEAEDPGRAPDFPGVIGAMVDEYLWEREIEAPGTTLVRAPYLRAFGEAHSELGLFEDLRARHVLDFATRHVAERGLLHERPEVASLVVLDAVRDFAQWADREHDLGLWADFEDAYAALERDLVRTATVSAELAARRRSAATVRREHVDFAPSAWARAIDDGTSAHFEGDVVATDLRGGAVDTRDGDWLVGRIERGLFRVFAVLPPVAGELRRDAGEDTHEVDAELEDDVS
jgi:hypothetical protein